MYVCVGAVFAAKVAQCGIENIHVMRDSLTALLVACHSGEVGFAPAV
jgi:hypothetical protein